MKKKRSAGIKIVLSLLLCLSLSNFVFADTITLKSGTKLKGKIIEKTDEHVKIDIYGVAITYSLDEIESIDEEKPALSSEKKEIITKEDIPAPPKKEKINEKAIFEERLSQFFTPAVTTATEKPSIEGLLKMGVVSFKEVKLLKFSKDFPNSKFADDAVLVIYFMSFIGGTLKVDEKAVFRDINKVEKLAKRYPNGKLEDFTYYKLVEMMGVENVGPETAFVAIRMPYKYIPSYMRGHHAFNAKDSQTVIDNFSTLLKDELVDNKNYAACFKYDVYPSLAVAYLEIGKHEQAIAIGKEALGRFPDSGEFKKTMERIIALAESKQ